MSCDCATPDEPARASRTGLLFIALAVAAGAVLVARWAGATEWTGTFAAYFFAIILSAVPYVLLGAWLSGFLEVYLPPTLLVGVTKRLGLWGIPAMALAAPLFPICECGVVSVIRGLLRKGLPLHYALTYLLAAPIVNPIVLLSTYMAFQSTRYALCRGVGGLFVAIGIGLVFSRVNPERALLPGFLKNTACGDCCDEEEPTVRGRADSMLLVAHHARVDLLEMLPYFMAGVFVASAMKTSLGDYVLSLAGTYPLAGPAIMMAMAFVLSLCSEADAFPAASFTGFSIVAHMGFLVLGPMLDIKLLLMYRTVFKTWFIVLFAVSIVGGVAAYLALLELFL